MLVRLFPQMTNDQNRQRVYARLWYELRMYGVARLRLQSRHERRLRHEVQRSNADASSAGRAALKIGQTAKNGSENEVFEILTANKM